LLTIRKLSNKLAKIPEEEQDGIISHIKFEEKTDDLIIVMVSGVSYGFPKENL
jgi:hypothetical protein